jgi:RNA polymerase sigma factor (sigma-70 family)
VNDIILKTGSKSCGLAFDVRAHALQRPYEAPMTTPTSNPNQARPGAVFVTTRWSVVLAAGLSVSAESEQALAQLCRTYWYPLYAFVRRQGRSPEDAEDLTQSFFERLLEKKALGGVKPEKGKFRSFLLAALKNFMANDWNRQHAAKRGGHNPIVSLDNDSAEDRFLREPSRDATPEKLYEQSWALTVLETVLQQLRKEYTAAGKGQLFEALQDHLIGDENAAAYANAAAGLGMKEGTVRMAVLRMRRHFGYLLRHEIAHTVADPAELEEELRHLVTSMRG